MLPTFTVPLIRSFMPEYTSSLKMWIPALGIHMFSTLVALFCYPLILGD